MYTHTHNFQYANAVWSEGRVSAVSESERKNIADVADFLKISQCTSLTFHADSL